jgi:protease I
MKRLKIIKTSILQSVFDVPSGTQQAPEGQVAKWAVVITVLASLVWQNCQICQGQRRPRGAPLRIIQLPQPKLASQGGLSFEEAVVKQRITSVSTTGLSNRQISFEQIGQLAWAGQGTIESSPQTVSQQSASGQLPGRQVSQQVQGIYPVSLFFVTPSGVYVYNPNGHSLEQTYDRDVRAALAPTVANPEAVTAASCDIIIAGPIKDPTGRPANVARRLSLLQAGQNAQNIQLQAASLNLASVPVINFDSRNIVRICNLPRGLEVLYIISVGYPAESTGSAQQSAGTVPSVQNRVMSKKAVLIVGGEDFNDRELFETMRVLGAAGVQTFIASSRLGLIRGTTGGVAESGILMNQLRIDDFNAVVFIGGNGAREYFANPDALNIVREAAAKKKVLAAISTAPTILANAGVLRNIRVTGAITERTTLQQAGAVYTGNHVERDGLIITSTGPIAVVQFAAAIVEALAEK